MHVSNQGFSSHSPMMYAPLPDAPQHAGRRRHPGLGVRWRVALGLLLLSTGAWAAPPGAQVTVENWNKIGFALVRLDIARHRELLNTTPEPTPQAERALESIHQRRKLRLLARYGTTATAYVAFGAAHRPALEAYRAAHPEIATTWAELTDVVRPLQQRLQARTTAQTSARLAQVEAELQQMDEENKAQFMPPARPSDVVRLEPRAAEAQRRDAPVPFPEQVGVCLGLDPLLIPHCLLMDRNHDERVDLHDLCALAIERAAPPCPFVDTPLPRLLSEGLPVYPVNQVLVRFLPGTPVAAATALAQTVQGRVVGIIPILDLYQLEVPTTTPEALEQVLGVLLRAEEPVVSVQRYVMTVR